MREFDIKVNKLLFYFMCTTMMLSTSHMLIAQCTNSSSYGSGAINPGGNIVTISTCSFAGEYSPISGAVAGQTLQFTSGTTDFITIHSGSSNGAVVAFGNSPLSFSNTYTGTLYAHWNTNSSCGTESACRTTTVQCTSCSGGGDPCSSITNITCGSSTTVTATGTGLWSPSSCGWYTPGQENLYSFTPTVTGTYTLNVTASYGGYVDYQYKAASGGCSSTGWTCIKDIFSPTTVTFGPLTAGVQYYILLDPETTLSISHTFQINCLAPPGCENLSSFGSAAAPTSSTPITITTCAFTGEYSTVTGAVSGSTYTFNATGGTGNYITIRQGTSGGTILGAGFAPLNVVCTSSGSLYMHLNADATCGGSDGSCHTETVACNSCGDEGNQPCDSITNISCGTSTTANAVGDGVWNSQGCGYDTPGQENIYSFTPTVTGIYKLEVTASSGGYVDYQYKAASGGCNSTGWTCIQDIYSPTTENFGPLTAGVEYYILLDPEDQEGAISQTFVINCDVVDPCANITTLTCGTPVTANAVGEGVWDSESCGYNTPGQEFIYSFTPSVMGTYELEVTSSTGGYLDYSYKAASGGCIDTGWICIQDIYDSTTVTFGPLTAGIEYFIMVDAEGGEGPSDVSQTFQINCLCNFEPTIAIIESSGIPNDGVICAGSSATLQATGGGTYLWSTNETTSSITVSPTSTQVYSVTVTTSDSCIGSATATLTVIPLPTPTASASPNPICAGKTLSLSASGGTSYAWSGPAGYISSLQNPSIADIQISHGGLYTVTVTNTTGCSNTASVNVIVNPLPTATASASPNPICVGNTLNLSASGGISYTWSGPLGYSSSLQNPAIANIQLNQAGVYFVTVTSQSGCTAATSVNVVVNPLPVPTAGASPNPICVGNTLSLSASGGTSYTWSGPSGYSSSLQNPTIANIQLNQGGVYFVTVTSQSGCTAATSVNVVVNPLPVPTAGASPNPICVGKTLSLTSSGGTSYAWSGPGGFSSFTQNPSIANIQLSQDGIYIVTVTNTNGCTNTASVDVVVNPLPNATAIASPNPVCEGDVAKFSANGGVGYHWSGPNGFTTDNKEFGLHMALNMAGTYYVTVTNSTGCSKTASVNVTVNAGPNASASVSPNPACSGESVQFSASGGTNYKWTGPNGFSSNLQNPLISNAQQYHSGVYTVEVSNASGCKKTLSLTLVVNQTPAGKISYDVNSTCLGDTLFLFASWGASWQWSGPAGFSSTEMNPIRLNANSSFSGLYSVVITSYLGCSVTQSVYITIHSLPVISAWTTTPEVCQDGSAFLYAYGGTSYDWSGPYGYASTFQNPIITNIPIYMTGTYTVTGGNEFGCTAKASVFITVQSVNAIVNATPNPVPNGGTLYLTASGGTSYQWTGPNGFNTVQQNPIIYKFSKPNEGLYSCIVSSSAGCQDTKIILIQVRPNGFAGNEYDTKKIEGNYVQVFPNPASTSIKLDDEFKGMSEYQILNGQGQVIMTGKSQSGEQIQISTLTPGAYYIHWNYQNETDKNISNISRFVKTH